MFTKARVFLGMMAAAALAAVGCDSQPRVYQSVPQQQPQVIYQQPVQAAPQQVVAQFAPSINPGDFDLATATALVTSGRFPNMQALEAEVNKPAINNLDVDRDGQFDYVTARESAAPAGNGTQIQFETYPSSHGANAQPVPVASVTATQDLASNRVAVQSSYSTLVPGWQNYGYTHYHSGLTFGQGMLLGYLMRPHAYYVPAYSYGSYVARPVLAPSQLTTTRQSYQTTTRVTPIAKTPVPNTYQQPAVAARQPSAIATSQATGSVTGNAQQMRDFKARDTAAPKQMGTAFGAGAPAAAPSAPRAPTQYAAPAAPAAPRAPTQYAAPAAPTASPRPTLMPRANSAPAAAPSAPRQSAPAPRAPTPTKSSFGGGTKRR